MKKMLLASNEEILNISVPAKNKTSGVTFVQNNERRIINNQYHTLVVGEDNIQKEQKVICPLIEQIISTNESFVVNDKSGSLYNKYSAKLKEEGYKVICLNFDNPAKGDGFNILELAYNMYKEKNQDKAIEILENIGYYLFYEKNNQNSDPFWVNSAISLFLGCVLYLFDSGKDITLNKIGQLVDTINIDDMDKNTTAYGYLTGILKAPPETKASIISVFKQKFNLYSMRENLSKMISNSTFDIKEIGNKTAIFIIEGTSDISKSLISLIINQIYYACSINNNDKRINLLIDDFDNICPIKNIESIISLFDDLNINATAFIKNFNSLDKEYGEGSYRTLKLYFKNLIYLYSDDITTLEYISRLCGSDEYMSNLRNIKDNEALFIIVRVLPFIVNI